MSKILLITDAWLPSTNGVVTTLTNLVKESEKNGDTIEVIHPYRCGIKFPLFAYPDVIIGIMSPIGIRRILKQHWDHIHIATPEGALGFAFSRMCNWMNLPFSTSSHTKFPEFINSRYPWIKISWGWAWMKYVYKGSIKILTTTETMAVELRKHGFKQEVVAWTRGVDNEQFNPISNFDKKTPPLLVCVSRVSHEKGLDDFCQLADIYEKIVVGDGPYLKELEGKYPNVKFVGKKKGAELATYYQNADVFVFPSRTDTFGVVMLESMACGTPIASYPVTGPVDIIETGVNGYMDDSLEVAIQKCVELDRNIVVESSKKWTWAECYRQFKNILIDIE